jgi:hypothetical protein
MAANFLQRSRHDSVFYFRRRVPADLFDSLRKRQIYKSLDPCDRREAIIRARALAAQTDRLFASLRAMPKPNARRIDYTLELRFDHSGLPQAVKIEAEPGTGEMPLAVGQKSRISTPRQMSGALFRRTELADESRTHKRLMRSISILPGRTRTAT